MCPKSNKTKFVKVPLNSYQIQKLEYLANINGVSPNFIIFQLEKVLERLIKGRTVDESLEVINCIRIQKLKRDIDTKKREIAQIKDSIEELKRRLKEYEDDYLAIIELGKALDSLLKVSEGEKNG